MAIFEPSEDGVGPLRVELRFSSCSIGCDFGTSAPSGACELYLFSDEDEVVYLLASVMPGSAQDGISSVKMFGHDARDYGQTTATNSRYQEPNGAWAIVVHDLHIAAGGGCSAAYMIEFADDPAALDSK
jgi:hypothetical protein